MVYNGFTSVGSLYQAKCLANNLPVKFKNVKVGDGLVSGQDPTTFTDLLSVKQEVEILSKTQSSNIARLLVQITNDSITTGYQVSEIGIYVEDSDGSEVLYWYINRGAEGSFMPQAATAPTALKYYLNITVTSVESLVVDWTGKGIWVDYENMGIQLARILGVSEYNYQGILNTGNTKIAGNAYYDTATNQVYYCVKNNNLNYVDANYYTPISNKPLSDRIDTIAASIGTSSTSLKNYIDGQDGLLQSQINALGTSDTNLKNYVDGQDTNLQNQINNLVDSGGGFLRIGAVIIQWGIAKKAQGVANFEVKYSIQFPNAPLALVSTPYGTGTIATSQSNFSPTDPKTSFFLQMYDILGNTWLSEMLSSWIAIGY